MKDSGNDTGQKDKEQFKNLTWTHYSLLNKGKI